MARDRRNEAHILLITGQPGVGKTTVMRRVAEKLDRAGLRGFHTEKIREAGERRGFRLVGFDGTRRVVALVDLPKRYRVGRYGVDLEALGHAAALLRPDPDARVHLIAEIGKMECLSAPFASSPAISRSWPRSASGAEASSPRSKSDRTATSGKSPATTATNSRLAS